MKDDEPCTSMATILRARLLIPPSQPWYEESEQLPDGDTTELCVCEVCGAEHDQGWEHDCDEVEDNGSICVDCGVQDDELHVLGCERERCPFCFDRLLRCGCVYHHLRLYDTERYDRTTGFLPPEIFVRGISEEQLTLWETRLNAVGRLAFDGA